MTTQLHVPLIAPRWQSPLVYEDSDGPEVRDFVEQFCRNTKASFGSEAGELVLLRDWQSILIDDLYELRPDGSRRHRRGLIGLPKKSGKSLLGSTLAIHALVGEGEYGAEVYSCAAAKDQARIVFDVAKAMVEADPHLAKVLKVYRNVIEYPKTGSVYRVLSADADLQDGLNPSFVCFDEVHRQPNGDLWAIMSNAISTRPKALILGITTAGHDRDSLCYKLYDYGKRVSSGEVEDETFFFRWWEPQDGKADYQDPEVWQQANPGFGDFQSPEDFEATAKSTPENEFRRYRLNQWTSTYSAWLKAGAWDARKSDRALQPKESVVLGFDGSWANDSTALVACAVDGLHLQVIDAWEKPDGQDDWRVDIADVEEAIRQACRTYSVSSVVCDPSFWRPTLQKLADEGLPMVEFPNSITRMVESTKVFEDAVYEGRLSHNGDPRLARHVNNCIIKTDRRSDGHYITKEYRSSSRKIDLAVASLMAVFKASGSHKKKASLPDIQWI